MLGLTLRQVCERSSAPYSTVMRWRSDQVSPSIRLFTEVIGRIEAVLAAEERILLVHLAGLHPDLVQLCEARAA